MQFDRLGRRQFIRLVGGVGIAFRASVARAQVADKRPLIGVLTGGEKIEGFESFREGMKELGYVEGKTIGIAIRSAEGHLDHLPALAEELAKLKPSLIVASNTGATIAAKNAAPSVPIVSAVLTDPLRLGLIESYAKPGGNITGILTAVEGVTSKQFEIARELIPGVTKVGLLVNVANVGNQSQRREIEAAAAMGGVKIVAAEIREPDDLDGAFHLLANERVPVLITLRDSLTLSVPGRVVGLAAGTQLPTVYGFREFVVAGGLISYGVNLAASWKRIAVLVDKILKGERAGDIPVEFPTKLEMLINLKTAKTLGLTIPQTLLVAADEVIE